jgi:hypothetical protein
MGRTNVIHGARVVFRFNGERFALGQNCEVTERVPLQPVDPVGTPETVEHIAVGYEVDVNFTFYRPTEGSLKAAGIFPTTSDPRAILEFEGVTAEVEDIDAGQTVERLTEFRIEEVSRAYTKGQLTMYNVRGKAIKATDEFEN